MQALARPRRGRARERAAAPPGRARRAAAARPAARSARLPGRGGRACPPGWRRCCWPSCRAAEAIAFGRQHRRARAARAAREHAARHRATTLRGAAARPSGRARRSTASAVAPDALARAAARRARGDRRAWRDGLFAIEDAGAQVVVELCGAAPGERILDACAGLGGKSAHLRRWRANGARIDARRHRAREARGRRASASRGWACAARRPPRGRPDAAAAPTRRARYHRVLLDAPCSGLGVLRRHPEALARRAPADLGALAAQTAAHARPPWRRPAAGRRARLRGLHVRAPRVRGRRRGVPARPPAGSRSSRRGRGRPRALGAPRRRRRARSGPGRTATTRTRFSRFDCGSQCRDEYNGAHDDGRRGPARGRAPPGRLAVHLRRRRRPGWLPVDGQPSLLLRSNTALMTALRCTLTADSVTVASVSMKQYDEFKG